MPIISISLNDEILSEIDKLQKSMGFSGRSEIVRAGLRTLISEEKQRSNLSGLIHAILMVVHDEESEQIVTGIKHNHEDLIGTHLHSKIDGNKCMELFLLRGEAEKVDVMTRDFQTNRKMDHVKLVAM
ncbi:MAG: CopG family ribbon-helix-helix protein [Thaumarchaeota archaeon]|jgi:CopG family nickel-responsive transcriptional regulator|nr:CopG family ribbon-helix-helix protein [Nitrososphaerota archaeon]MBI3642128.1 CopG family ribbon-helix-helix protein [Nitrososphaerota archaeon]